VGAPLTSWQTRSAVSRQPPRPAVDRRSAPGERWVGVSRPNPGRTPI